MNRKIVIRSSWNEKIPNSKKECAIDAISTPPTPSVVALVGACSRDIGLLSFTSPNEPISPKLPAAISKSEMRISAMMFMLPSFDDVAAQDEPRIGNRRDEPGHGEDHRRL